MNKAIEITLPNFSDADSKLREFDDQFNIDHGPVDEYSGKVVVWSRAGDLGTLINYLTLQLIPYKVIDMEALAQNTKEMEDWFEERTKNHIKGVKKYSRIFKAYDPARFRDLVEIAEHHDDSKFEEPERTPYIALTWKHKFDNYKSYKVPGTIDDEAINQATLHHVKGNEHHPEHWTDQETELINKENRDKPPREIVDATRMPDIAIAEMVADWASMSDELGTSLRGWADKNIGKRWKFNDDQVKLIYELISVAEEHQ